ncbi:hypothetical protein [Burkholderia glumae]|uniref:hypothetical protein n=1 Tax=Burkholderia glumae TaxID=337 RepID=UPI0020371C4B|nr:hypothetical protein [Burkholderia glumae]MCM2496039.1 hypothetical protein [Burkholderia glumae]
MSRDPKQIFDDLREQVEQLQSAFPDRAIVVFETPSAGVSSGYRGSLEHKSLLRRVTLHADGTIIFYAVPGTRAGGNAGIWRSEYMRIEPSLTNRADIVGGRAPNRVIFSEVGFP